MISMVQDMAGKLAQQRFSPQKINQPNFNMTDPNGMASMNENGARAVKSTNNRGVQTKSWLSNATGIDLDANRAVNQLTHAPSQIASQVGQGLSNAVRPFAGYFTPPDISHAIGAAISALEAARRPTTPDTTDQVRAQQQQSYEDFKKNLPGYQRQMQEGLANTANKSMYQNMRSVDQQNTSRGLGYGGLNESMQAGEQARAQQNLANQITQGNVGLLDLGDQIQSGAITTGLGQQSNLQQRLNQLYQQQMAQYNANNQMAGSQMGLLANLGLNAALRG